MPAGGRPVPSPAQAGGWPPPSVAGPPAAGGSAGLGIPEPPQPPPLPAPGGTPASGRPRSAFRTTLLALIALVVIAGGGYYALTHRTGTPAPAPSASGRPTPTATPTPTPTATTTVTFTDPGHDFSAAFPATPQSTVQSEPVDGATLNYTGWIAVDPSSGDQYLVIDMPYPASVNVSDPQLGLQTGVASMVSALKATVVSQTAGTADGYPDVDVLISTSGVYIDYRCILAGHAFYGAGVESAQNPPPGFAAFAASLTIYSTAAATG